MIVSTSGPSFFLSAAKYGCFRLVTSRLETSISSRSCSILQQRHLQTVYRNFWSSNTHVESTTSSSEPALALIFDTETTGLVKYKKSFSDDSQPNLVQLGMLLVDTLNWQKKLQVSLLIQPHQPPDENESYIHPGAQKVHGIRHEDCCNFGVPLETALNLFCDACAQADCLVAHNLKFDRSVMQTAMFRSHSQKNTDTDKVIDFLRDMPQVCTMEAATDVLKLPGKFRSYKWPTLEESFHYFKEKDATMPQAHDALGDTEACMTVLRGLLEHRFVAPIEKKNAMKSESPMLSKLIVFE